jgi:hypothetical protein
VSLWDDLDSLVTRISKHPGAEELIGALPLLAGTVLMARGQASPYGSTRIGTPLGAGLSALGGGLVAHGLSHEPPPPATPTSVTFINPKANQLASLTPSTGTTQPTSIPSGFEPLSVWEAQQKPSKPSAWEEFKAKHSNLSIDEQIKQFKALQEKPANPWVPNPINARAMAILGTTDPRVLAQHPEAIEQAKREDTEQQKQIAAANRAPREPHRQALVDASGKVTGMLDLDTGKVLPVIGPDLYKTPPKTSAFKYQRFGNEVYRIGVKPDGSPDFNKALDIPPAVKNKSEYSDFASGYLDKNPGADGMEVAKAYDDFKNTEAAARTTVTGKAKAALPKVEASWDAAKAAALVARVTSTTRTELSAPGGLFSFGSPTPPSPAVLKAAVKKRLAALGADENGWGPHSSKPPNLPAAAPEGAKVSLP